MTRLRVGLLGCGGIGARHAQAVTALSDLLTLVACCGRDDGRTQAFAATHGATGYTDLARLLDEARPDLMIVALPPFAHSGEVALIARAGVHLLVEKPIALTQADAELMVAAVEATEVTAAVGFVYRHGAAVKAWDADAAGTVGMMTASFECNHLHAPWWRDEAKSGGQIVEQAIHLIDLIRHHMGMPDAVMARRARLFHAEGDYTGEDASATIFGWDDGRMATLTANNIAVSGIWHKRWALFAEHRAGRFTGWNDAVFQNADGGDTRLIAASEDAFVVQLRDLADAIRDRRPPLVPLRDGAATLRLALAARQAADERREVRIDAL